MCDGFRLKGIEEIGGWELCTRADFSSIWLKLVKIQTILTCVALTKKLERKLKQNKWYFHAQTFSIIYSRKKNVKVQYLLIYISFQSIQYRVHLNRLYLKTSCLATSFIRTSSHWLPSGSRKFIRDINNSQHHT